MTSREQTMWVRLALGAMLAAALTPFANAQAPAAAPAQGQGRGQGRGRGAGGRAAAPLYTPAPGAKDLKSVLFNWAWYMGMLRSSEERDLIMTLEYQGKGTVQVDGQPCNVTRSEEHTSELQSRENLV